MSTAADPGLVVCGATVYHRVDEEATALFERAVRVLARCGYLKQVGGDWVWTAAAERWDGGGWSSDGTTGLWNRVGRRFATKHPDRRFWWLPYPHEVPIGWKLTTCGYLRCGKAMPVAAARHMRPCASNACWPGSRDGRPALYRVDVTGARRAYMHALECEVCQHQGVAACDLFPKLALREIDSDVDPRLDPDA